jgi:hypothetical protein
MCGCTLSQTGQTSTKNGVGIFHLNLFVRLFEDDRDKVKESVEEGGVYFDDVVALLECLTVVDFEVGVIVGLGTSTVVGYIRNFNRKRIVPIGVCLTAGIVAVEGGIDGNVQEIHLLGDGGFVCLCTLAQVLQEIVEDKKVGGTQTQFGQCCKGKAHSGSRGFCVR